MNNMSLGHALYCHAPLQEGQRSVYSSSGSGWISENGLKLNGRNPLFDCSRWSSDSPGPAEDEGVLDGHQRAQLGALRVMVLATVLTPCKHTSHLSPQPRVTPSAVQLGSYSQMNSSGACSAIMPTYKWERSSSDHHHATKSKQVPHRAPYRREVVSSVWNFPACTHI